MTKEHFHAITTSSLEFFNKHICNKSFTALLLLTVSLTSGYAQDSLFITRKAPSTSWERALPIGNRTIGAKVFGGVEIDSILLVDNAFLNEQGYTSGTPYPSFAKLTITDNNKQAANFIKQSLNLNRSLLTEEYEQDGDVFSREYFASYPDRVIGIRLRCKNSTNGEMQNNINCTLCLTSNFDVALETNESSITMKGNCISDNNKTLFHTRLIINSTDGKLNKKDNSITIKDASEVTLYLINETGIATNSETVSQIDSKISDEIELQTERLKMKEYDKIRFFHISDYRNIFARFAPSSKMSKEDLLDAVYQNYLFISWPLRK